MTEIKLSIEDAESLRRQRRELDAAKLAACDELIAIERRRLAILAEIGVLTGNLRNRETELRLHAGAGDGYRLDIEGGRLVAGEDPESGRACHW